MIRFVRRIRGITISTGFNADPAAIGKLAALLERAGSAAGLYAAAAQGPNEAAEGLLGMLAAPLDRWQALGIANDRKAETPAHTCDTTLGALAKMYRTTDPEAAGK